MEYTLTVPSAAVLFFTAYVLPCVKLHSWTCRPHGLPRLTGDRLAAVNADQSSYNGFDHHQNMVLSGLQLDEVEVPKRGASRANSVRFDDSATTNHWIHQGSSPGTSDYFNQRSVGGHVGGYAMTERSPSHKSDGRQSSVRSFGGEIQTPPQLESLSRPVSQPRDVTPHISQDTPTPAMVRCLLNTPSPDPLLYAVICTGSSRSLIEKSLLSRLQLDAQIEKTPSGEAHIQLSVFLPDANMQQQHARPSGHGRYARLLVNFTVIPEKRRSNDTRDVGIFLGSDIIAAHMGDVLFSQSQLLLHAEDGRKVYVPFYRPDSQKSFSDIFTLHTDELLDFSNDPQKWGKPNGVPTQQHEALQVTDPIRGDTAVSSPRPIQGRQASVIREVAAMSSPDFAPQEPQIPTADTSSNKTPPEPAREQPWEERKTSFSAEVLMNDRSKSAQSMPTENGSQTPADSTSDAEKTDNETVTRGRSLTNPYASSTPLSRHYTTSVWDAAKKPIGTNSTPSTRDGAPTWGSQSRVSSRGMKVLRTSKSFSSDKAMNQSSAQSEPSSTPIGPPKPSILTSSKPGWKANHSRAVSGDSNSLGKGSLSRTKSSNVVGGASAFHWMAPKPTTTAGDDH